MLGSDELTFVSGPLPLSFVASECYDPHMCKLMVLPRGFEPRLTDSKSAVLPLDDGRSYRLLQYSVYVFVSVALEVGSVHLPENSCGERIVVFGIAIKPQPLPMRFEHLPVD